MVTPLYYPVTGGTESVVENTALKLNELGVDADIMSLNYNTALKNVWSEKSEIINGLNVFKIAAWKLPKTIFFINYLPAHFRRKMKQYDIVHFHNEADLSFPLFSYGLSLPKLLHCHCLDTTYYGYKARAPVGRQILLRSANIFVTLSRFLSEMLFDLGVPREKIRIVPNGVDVTKFKEGAEKKVENLLLFVGRLDPKKGIPVLLQSLKYLKTPVKLVMIGPPTLGCASYSKTILKLIDDTSKKTIHNITHLGKVGPDELVRWYQKASIFVLPSLSESFPMVNMESLACGTPVVASNVGAVSEVVRDYENGILVPPGNPIKLSEALQYLLDNEDTRLKLGKKGVKCIAENFSSKATAELLIKIYRSLL